MSAHTPEPWMENGLYVLSSDNFALARMTDGKGDAVANSARIVACVNALAGLTDEALAGGWTYAGQNAYALKLEKKLERLRADRDALLEALNKIWKRAVPHPDDNATDVKRDMHHVESLARAAIQRERT